MEKHIVINEKEMYERFLASLDNSYTLYYVGREEEYTPRIVQECLKERSKEPLCEADWFYDTRRHYAVDELQRLMFRFVNNPWTAEQMEFFKESDEYGMLIDEILDRDDSTPEMDCWNKTRVHLRLTLNSNYDCWIPPYDSGGLRAKDDALEGMMKALSLNPRKVKAAAVKKGFDCLGVWPNLPMREGKEIVSYEGFVECLSECPSYGLWTFFGLADMKALWDADMEPEKLVIPKGTTCTLFNSWNGGGSCAETKTIRDTSIAQLNAAAKTQYDKVSLCVDENDIRDHGYPSISVYGGYLSNEPILCKPETITK